MEAIDLENWEEAPVDSFDRRSPWEQEDCVFKKCCKKYKKKGKKRCKSCPNR